MEKKYLASPHTYRVQKTIKEPIVFEGVGLHSGVTTKIRLCPAPPQHGVVFERRDLPKVARIYAHYDAVVATDLATTVGFKDVPEARVSTVEHLLAALFALGVTNVLVEVEGPEIPILDGSASPFIDAILATGLKVQPFSNPTLKILKPIRLYQKGAICELLPRDRLRLTTSIDFPHPSIGLQTFALDLTPEVFESQVGSARTFGFMRDVERLKNLKLAQGASLENVLAFSDDGVVNPEGARFDDECVRHKLLDALGDLALCGCWIEGEMVSYRGGHSIHLALLQSLKQFRSHWEILPSRPMAAPQPSAFVYA